MKFTDWAQSHRRSILFLLASFAIAGLVSSWSLPVSLFPKVNFPRVVVNLDAGDRPAERMAIEVTWPVEEAVRSVPGVRSVRSTTSRGTADISINFEWGQDMVASMLEVESAINRTLSSLPPGLTFDVRRMDLTVFPVLGYSLTSDILPLTRLRDLALYQLRPVLSTAPGLARVEVQGGAVTEFQVFADPVKLNSFGLTLDDLARALSAANVIAAVGRLEEHNKLYLILSDTQFENLDQIAQTVVRQSSSGVIRVEDVATVSEGAMPQWNRVTADGHDAVLLQLFMQPGGNVVAIKRAVEAKLTEVRKILPPGVRIANWYDQSELTLSSADSVRDAVIVGVVMAALILFLFLRNLKMTLIAAMTVPMVLMTTVLLLSVLNMSFNIMTLGGMAASVGLIVDDAIVMVEHLTRRLRDRTGDYRQVALDAASEFTRPLSGSSASTIIIFAPLAFLSGVTGAFFKALSLTMAASLVISFVVSWLAVPLITLRLISKKDAEQKEGGRITDWAHRQYTRAMHSALPRPWMLLLLVLPLAALGGLAYTRVGSGFMPAMDEGGFIIDYLARPGTSLTETARLLRQVEAILRETPEVETYSRRTGLQLGGGITEASEGDFFVRLKAPPRRNIEAVMDDVRGKVERTVPGLEIEMLQLMEDVIGDLTAVPQPIEVKLYSDDGKLLSDLAPRVAAAVEKVPGVVDVKSGIVLAGDALSIRVDRENAALEGLDPDQVTTMLGDFLEGRVTTNVQRGPKMVGVRVWIPAPSRDRDRDLENLLLRAPDGHLVPLKRVAAIAPVIGEPQIMREDLKRMVAVTARISGRDLGSTIRDLKAALSQPGLIPGDVYYQLGGLYEQQRIAFTGLLAVFAAALVLVFALLLFLYESFRVALAMALTTLLAVAAVFIGLWLSGIELNISSMMGMTMVVGIVTEVAIIYYSEVHEMESEPDPAERLIAAGRNRMRPIAMTTLAAILALLPLALGVGQGAQMQQPLAVAIISGLAVQLPLVLIVLPTLLMIFKFGRRPGPASFPSSEANITKK